MEQKWDYILHIEGGELNGLQDAGRFREKHYFSAMSDALRTLLSFNIRLFDKDIVRMDEGSKYYTYAGIEDTGSGETLALINKISFNDSPDGSPPAGIYLHCEPDIARIETMAGISFRNFALYDADIPFINLATFTYEGRLLLTPDPALNTLQYGLWINEHTEGQTPAGYQYKLLVQERDLNDELAVAMNGNVYRQFYHYQRLNNVFYDMLKLDMRKMDDRVLEEYNLTEKIEQVLVSSRKGQELVALTCLKDIRHAREGENGVYLKFFIPIQAFEKACDTDLSVLDQYRNLQPYQQIFRFTADYQDLLPAQGYTKLIKQSFGEEAHTILGRYRNESACTLKVEWEFGERAGLMGADQRATVEIRPYVSVMEAFRELLALDNDLYGEQKAEGKPPFLNIKQATIIDSADHKDIMSLFSGHSTDSYVPEGKVLKLYKEKVSADLLLAILPEVVARQRTGGFHILVCGSKEKIRSQSLPGHPVTETRSVRKGPPF